MTLPEISIRRYVLAWMISGIFVLLGIIGFQKIGIEVSIEATSHSAAFRGLLGGSVYRWGSATSR